MKTYICPYLGLRKDAKTAFNYPSSANRCYKTRFALPPNSEQQESLCLTEEYANCPILNSEQTMVMPYHLVSTDFLKVQGKRAVLSLAIIVLVFVLASPVRQLWSLIDETEVVKTVDSGNEGVTLRETKQTNLFTFLDFGGKQSPTPFQPAKKTALSSQPPVTCSIPADWIPYDVKPMDSIYRLSLIYGVSSEELLQGNCLEGTEILQVGQIIFLPPQPTATPTMTPTPTRTRVPYVYPSNTPAPTRKPRNDKPTAQPVPPTATQKPPTRTSPPPTRTEAPPPINTPTNPPPEPPTPTSPPENPTMQPNPTVPLNPTSPSNSTQPALPTSPP